MSRSRRLYRIREELKESIDDGSDRRSAALGLTDALLGLYACNTWGRNELHALERDIRRVEDAYPRGQRSGISQLLCLAHDKARRMDGSLARRRGFNHAPPQPVEAAGTV